MKVSLVIPIYNEVESLPDLYKEICAVIDGQTWDAELVLVDDGSRDGSDAVLAELALEDPRCVVLSFARNFGQTAALAAGFDHASGEVIVPLDADLQNDPADIPRLLAKLDEGFDVVSGWRKDRQDKLLTRRLPSVLANRLISKSTGVALHDYGCTLKAYRSSVVKGVRLYGEMHRFIPVYASWQGGRVTELVVNHRARVHGTSKYGLNRTLKVLLDLLTMKLLGAYSTKPAYLFGGMGFMSMALGALAFLIAAVELVFWNTWPHRFTLIILASFLALAGIVMVMMGLLAELTVRIYHEAQDKPTYLLKKPPQESSASDSGQASP